MISSPVVSSANRRPASFNNKQYLLSIAALVSPGKKKKEKKRNRSDPTVLSQGKIVLWIHVFRSNGGCQKVAIVSVHSTTCPSACCSGQSEAITYGSWVGPDKNIITTLAQIGGCQTWRALETTSGQHNHFCPYFIPHRCGPRFLVTDYGTRDARALNPRGFLNELNHGRVG